MKTNHGRKRFHSNARYRFVMLIDQNSGDCMAFFWNRHQNEVAHLPASFELRFPDVRGKSCAEAASRL